MTASISVPARNAGRISADRLAGFGPLFRKELLEWAHSVRPWVIVVVTTLFMTLTASNAAINAWIVANVPDATVSGGPISLDPMSNFLAAIASNIFVMVAIFAAMSLLIAERERGTLAWVASKPVSRSAIWLSKWAAGATVITIVAGIVPMAATFAVVAVLYGSAGIGVFLLTAFGIAASVAFIVAVVLAASTVLSNQAAVAAIGFAVLFVPQILVGVLPVDLGPFLPTSIMSWAIGMAGGADVGVVTPVAWLVSVVAVAAFASWRMERLEF